MRKTEAERVARKITGATIHTNSKGEWWVEAPWPGDPTRPNRMVHLAFYKGALEWIGRHCGN